VALCEGPPAEGVGKTLSTVFGGALQPEGGAWDVAEWCDDDGTGARFGGGEKYTVAHRVVPFYRTRIPISCGGRTLSHRRTEF
jgi:hypothetical protein